MDTPLYVLSTAASMVESADVGATFHNNGKDLLEVSSSPQDKLPGRMQCRAGEQREHVPVLTTQHKQPGGATRPKKCTGTQTSLSSFGGSPYQRPGSRLQSDYPQQHEGSAGYTKSHLVHQRDSPPPPPPYSYQHATLSPSHTAFQQRNGCHDDPQGHTDMDTDSSNMPLNLTISSSSHQHHNSQTSSSRLSPSSQFYSCRPSVITRSVHTGCSQNQRGPADNVPRPPEVASTAGPGNISRRPTHDASTGDAPTSDPEIEEHFRRSLGKKYPDFLAPQNGPNMSTASNGDPQSNNVSITGNVDDHFAKSLGDTWTKLNAKKDANNSSGTVDDHFAKALGDTWFKIKAQKETLHAEPSAHMSVSSRSSFQGTCSSSAIHL